MMPVVVLQREVPLVPKTIPSAAQLSNFVAKTATVVGDVSLGKNTHVWYGAVVRGKNISDVSSNQ